MRCSELYEKWTTISTINNNWNRMERREAPDLNAIVFLLHIPSYYWHVMAHWGMYTHRPESGTI